jgi:hypothetical protein
MTVFWQRLVLAILSILSTVTAVSTGAPASSQEQGTVAVYERVAPQAVQAAPQSVITSRPYKVAIQIGHYKNSELPPELSRLVGSTGTSGGGRKEVDLNNDISQRVARLLRAQGVEVELLPATVPTGYNADAFIAIHADGNASTRARGFKISTRWSSQVAEQDGILVQKLTEAYSAATGLPEDSNVTRNMRGYYAYSPRRATWRLSNLTPGAIVEMGFMTNATDRAMMFNQPDRVAAGITNGIMNYLKLAYGAPATTASYGYGHGLIDDKVNPRATPVPTTRPGTSNSQGGPPRIQTGNWDLYLMALRPTVSVYSEPGGGALLGKIDTGKFVHSQTRRTDYYEVTLPDGTKGWIHRNTVVVKMQ